MELNQKYKNLKLSFLLEGVLFQAPSICLESLVKPFPMHSHSNDSYEIHYIPCGSGTLNTPGQTYPITPGTLFVTGPEIEHEQISSPEDPMLEYCVYLRAKRPEKKSGRKTAFIETFLNRPFWFGTGNLFLHELMKQMLTELNQQNAGCELMLQAQLMELVLSLCRLYQSEETSQTPHQSATGFFGDATSLLVEEAFLYHYDEITLESLAAQMGLGIRQAERYLKTHYNKTFQEKKTEARMSAAVTMLKDEKNSVSEIALALGYSSVEHFSNAFKRYYQNTPSQMRKTIRKHSSFVS